MTKTKSGEPIVEFFNISGPPAETDPKYFWRLDSIPGNWFFVHDSPLPFTQKWLAAYKKVSGKKVIDFTYLLQDRGREQTPEIFDVLLHGLVVPVPSGYVFLDDEGVDAKLGFLSECDTRCKEIRAVRRATLLKRFGAKGYVIDRTLAADFDPGNIYNMLYHLNMRLVES